MKKLFLILMLALLGMTQLAAQDDYDYVPFVREGVKWVYTYENYGGLSTPANPNLAYGTVYLTLELKGDTVINGKTYKAMHKYYGNAINTVNDTIPVYLREQDKVVYGFVPDGITYYDCPIGDLGSSIISNKIRNGEEFVLYDYQDPQAYWHSFYSPSFYEDCDYYDLQSTTHINIGTHIAKCYTFKTFRMIEGIGVDGLPNAYQWHGYTLFPQRDIFAGINAAAGADVDFRIRYVTEGDEIIYKSVNYEGPKPDSNDHEYVPFVREGVKWVYTYENYSDSVLGWTADPNLAYGTVYLTLELKGDTVINGKTYKAMHKYYGDAINTVNDTIPVYLREEDKVVYGIVPDSKTYPDCPIGNIYDYTLLSKMRNGDEFILYNFQDPQAYWRNLFSPDMSEADFQEYFDDFVLRSTDFMNIGSHMVKCHTFGTYRTGFRMIEGIGVDGKEDANVWFGYTLFPWTPIYVGVGNVHFRIRYVTEGDEIIYKSVNYEDKSDAIDEVVADGTRRPADPHYYNLMGQPVGTAVPTTPGIYIHQGRKVVVR